MPLPESDQWDVHNLAQRYTVSFFKSQYGDDPVFLTASANRLNNECGYFNVAGADPDTNAIICAGLITSYMESQGIPYHDERNRKECFQMLQSHLKQASGKVLHTADIVDYHFKFINE